MLSPFAVFFNSETPMSSSEEQPPKRPFHELPVATRPELAALYARLGTSPLERESKLALGVLYRKLAIRAKTL